MWHYVLVYGVFVFGFAVVAGHWFTFALADVLLDGSHRSDFGGVPSRPKLVGVVERVLYVAAILAGQGGFVVAWLALKAIGAGTWSRKGVSSVLPGDRDLYQRFLICSAASLLFSGGAALGVVWTLPMRGVIGAPPGSPLEHWWRSVAVCGGIAFLSLALTWWWVVIDRTWWSSDPSWGRRVVRAPDQYVRVRWALARKRKDVAQQRLEHRLTTDEPD